MTNHERAEKIADTIIASMGKAISCSDEDRDWLIEQITSQLDEAVREAFDDGYKTGYGDRHEAVEKIRAEGFASAKQQAAAIADHGYYNRAYEIAERIRAMEDK